MRRQPFVFSLASWGQILPMIPSRESLVVGPRLFKEVPKEVLWQQSDWSLLVRGRWHRPEHILRLEGRAHVIGLRHKLRSVRQRSFDHLCLIYTLALALALTKGRAASAQLNQTCREHFALSAAGNVHAVARWPPQRKTSRMPPHV